MPVERPHMHAAEVIRVCAHLGDDLFLVIDSGTVQVGFRFTDVIMAVSVGEGLSALPTITT